MREPSIHLTRTTLKELLNKHILKGVTDDAIDVLLSAARKLALDTRCIQSTTKKTEKKVDSITKSSLGDAQLLADVIYSARVKLKHIGVTKIKQGDSQWVQVKELVPTVNQFCEAYNLDYRKGYIEFVTIGLKLLSKTKKPNYNFCASWMNQRVDWILAMVEAERAIKEDNDSSYTIEICSIYSNELLERTGVNENYIKDPLQYVNFIKARDLADEIGCDYETFIQAQFAALEFCNGIPRIEDLHGDKAKQRVISYLAKNNLMIERDEEDSPKYFDWKKLKK